MYWNLCILGRVTLIESYNKLNMAYWLDRVALKGYNLVWGTAYRLEESSADECLPLY